MFSHGFTEDDLVRIVMAESQWISALYPFKTNAFDLVEIGVHVSLLSVKTRTVGREPLYCLRLFRRLNYDISHHT